MLGEERRAEHQGALTEPASGRLASPDIRDEFGLETIDMNMGPQHPAMHGLLRLILELDGETVVRCDPVMGYLHRCQEKIAENRMYPAVIPMTDRLDYFANMHNEHGYCLAVEDLLDVEIPPRAEYIRVLMCELMRLASHIPSIGFLMLELGAFTPILYAFRERERIQSIFEAVTGARMMFHYIRIGGVKADLPPDIPEKIWSFIECLESVKIIKQCLEKMPEGAVMADMGRRIRPPEGEGFGRVESPRGEFAVHVVSDGSDTPYRVHYRDPSFCNMQLLQEIVPGHYLPDIMPIMGLIDPVSGGWDK